MKILNLYAGIGGNRKLWGDCKVTAVEYDKNIAEIYKKQFPNDTILVEDAHKYLLNHYKEFDFIWGSPPCQTHSRARYIAGAKGEKFDNAIYPDMKLWQEIIFLQSYCKSKWVIENVIPFYKPLIQPTIKLQRHLFWSNFPIHKNKYFKPDNIQNNTVDDYEDSDLVKQSNIKNKLQVMRNKVNSDLGLYIFNCAIKGKTFDIGGLFS